MAIFKEYLGTLEVPIGDVLYEIGLRAEAQCMRGLWTCMVCQRTEAATELRPTNMEAIDLARSELMKHHQEAHGENSTCGSHKKC
jgi:hypothetical protein